MEIRDAVSAAAREQQLLRVLYRGRKDAKPRWRVIEVYDFDGRYIDARCRTSNEKRTFRFDRVHACELLPANFEYDPTLAEAVDQDGWASPLGSWRRSQARRVDAYTNAAPSTQHKRPFSLAGVLILSLLCLLAYGACAA